MAAVEVENKFDAKKAIDKIVKDTTAYFEDNNLKKKAIIGISGGKDSSVVAALCVKAFGKENVLGVMMPNGEQKDILDSINVCKILGIKNLTVNINRAYEGLTEAIASAFYDSSDGSMPDPDNVDQYRTNTPARLRMATLYGISAMVGGIVMNTSNKSEDKMGFSTLYGDHSGGFGPICDFTVTEVRAMGKELGLPEKLWNKTPSDGMCGVSDEEKLKKELGIENFSYENLDLLIRGNISAPFTSEEIKTIKERTKQFKYKTDIVRIPTVKSGLFEAF